MNPEDYLINSLTPEYHQNYVEARKQKAMNYIADYDLWLAKSQELLRLERQNKNDTWEASPHNPANYPDFDNLDEDTKVQRITQGKMDYWQDSEALEKKISDLEHLLSCPDEFQQVSISDDKSILDRLKAIITDLCQKW